jgi:signal transduction histidine kinase
MRPGTRVLVVGPPDETGPLADRVGVDERLTVSVRRPETVRPANLEAVDCLVVTDPESPATAVARSCEPPVPVVAADRDAEPGGGIDATVDPAAPGVELAAATRRAAQRAESSVVATLYRAARDLMRADDREEVAEVVVESAEAVLAMPMAGIHLDDGEGTLRPVAATDRIREVFGGEAPSYTADDDVVWSVYRSGDPVVVEEVAGWDLETPVESGIVVPVGTHGVLITSTGLPGAFDERYLDQVRLLAANAEAALDRVARESRLTALQESTRALIGARSREEVAQLGCAASREVLGLPFAAVYLRETDPERLEPAALSDSAEELVGEPATLSPDGSLTWEAIRSGEPQQFTGHTDEASDVRSRVTDLRSIVVYPLADHGAFIAGSPHPDAFDQPDEALAATLAATLEAALERAGHEEQLREREAELRRQNERLEEFASVVSHDLRNPLNVATGRLELGRGALESGDADAADGHLAAVERALDRMAGLVGDLLALARQGRSIGETEPVSVADLSRRYGATVDGIEVVTRPVEPVEADPERLRELVGNLLENAAHHAGPGVTVEVGPIDGGGFYVADDGPGLPDVDAAELFDRGYTTGGDGAGLGLAIVRAIAEAHGWEVTASEGVDGGARFEVTTGD